MSKLFQQMKKSQSDSLNNILQSEKTQTYIKESEDPRFWKCTQKKDGSGSATIRFLPPSQDAKVPFVKLYNHAFKNETTGKWYFENSRTTLSKDEKDPIAEANTVLWDMGEGSIGRKLVSGDPTKKEQNARKRKLAYYANVYIVNDPSNPENNGTVKIFKFGAKIHEKIMGKLKPKYEGVAPSIVYDMWNGSNFELRMKKSNGQTNYDDSEWDNPSALLDGDDSKLEAIWNSQHDIESFVSPDKFKPYEVLKANFIRAMGSDDIAVVKMGWASGTTGLSSRPTQSEDAPEHRSSPMAKASVDDGDDLPWTETPSPESAEDFFAGLDD